MSPVPSQTVPVLIALTKCYVAWASLTISSGLDLQQRIINYTVFDISIVIKVSVASRCQIMLDSYFCTDYFYGMNMQMLKQDFTV